MSTDLRPATDEAGAAPDRGAAATKPVRHWSPGRIAAYAVLVVLTLAFVSPLFFGLITSFKTQADAIASVPQWIPAHPAVTGYKALSETAGTPVLRWFANSMIAATAQALLVVAVASLAAYPLARLDFPGRKIVFTLVVSTLFVPAIILVVPNYVIVGKLQWLDSLMAIIVPGAASAFGVFFMRQFFLGMPVELEEAAEVDGASRLRTFWSVVLPNSRSALVTLGLLAFLGNWNDFVWPVYVLFSADQQTLPAGLATLQSANAVRYDILMAGAVIAAAPVLALYAVAQRFVIEGVSRSGIKG